MTFFTKIPNSMQLSRPIDIAIEKTNTIKPNSVEIIHKDNFLFLKNPSILFYDEIDEENYLFNLLNNFEQCCKFGTLNLPFEKLNLEINDEIFDQYFSQIQNVSDHRASVNSNYQRLFIKNGNQISPKTVDFKFELNFIKKIVLITNDNFVKLILSLLNCLSFWFDLNIFHFDFYLYELFLKLCPIFNFAFRLLFNLEEYLFRKLMNTIHLC